MDGVAMQRAARSIVPTENREGFVGDETDNSTTFFEFFEYVHELSPYLKF